MSQNTMHVEEDRFLKIRFNNGDERKFAFQPLSDDPSEVYTRVQKMVESRLFVLELDNQIIMIPFDNIVSIEVSPKPSVTRIETIVVRHEFSK